MRQVTEYRIFIASPGGLDAERQAFRKVINDYNESDALHDGLVFVPVGWDLARAGMGRPQEEINGLVRQCDYLVLILHDRWGTPPSDAGLYTSGTEEEYNIARQLLEAKKMRDILVFFKGVDPGRLSDPGPQLQKVLDFRESLEAKRELLFKRFQVLDEFETQLRFHLAAWRRTHSARNLR